MRLFVVDSFTAEPFRGNPAGVVLLTEPREAAWMQRVAEELKHSETAFVDLTSGEEGPLPLRWFTPAVEVDLCGHATLAAAHVLGGERTFTTRSGELHCRPGKGNTITMDFPADRPRPLDPTADLAHALPGVTIEAVARGRDDVLVRIKDVNELRALEPDLPAIAAIDARGVVVTTHGTDGADFASRCFYPATGVPEDPVTGSAHCLLGCYWSAELGHNDLMGHQLSPRGGAVAVSDEGERVRIGGEAVTVAEGTLAV
jgi:PhzF family phenazine biosynthesis protein